jgi:hypothetical protein
MRRLGAGQATMEDTCADLCRSRLRLSAHAPFWVGQATTEGTCASMGLGRLRSGDHELVWGWAGYDWAIVTGGPPSTKSESGKGCRTGSPLPEVAAKQTNRIGLWLFSRVPEPDPALIQVLLRGVSQLPALSHPPFLNHLIVFWGFEKKKGKNYRPKKPQKNPQKIQKVKKNVHTTQNDLEFLPVFSVPISSTSFPVPPSRSPYLPLVPRFLSHFRSLVLPPIAFFFFFLLLFLFFCCSSHSRHCSPPPSRYCPHKPPLFTLHSFLSLPLSLSSPLCLSLPPPLSLSLSLSLTHTHTHTHTHTYCLLPACPLSPASHLRRGNPPMGACSS